MPRKVLYYRRKGLKLCVNCGDRPSDPLVLLCPPCRELARERKATWTAANPARAQAAVRRSREAHAAATGPHLLACCGHWHAITTLPFTTLCCGTTYLQKGPR